MSKTKFVLNHYNDQKILISTPRLHSIIHRTIKMTWRTYPFLTCLDWLERVMYKAKLVLNHWNDQKMLITYNVQHSLQWLQAWHKGSCPLVILIDLWMIECSHWVIWSCPWFRTNFVLYISLSGDSKHVKKCHVLQVILIWWICVKMSGVLSKKTDTNSMDYNNFVSSLKKFSGINDKNNN